MLFILAPRRASVRLSDRVMQVFAVNYDIDRKASDLDLMSFHTSVQLEPRTPIYGYGNASHVFDQEYGDILKHLPDIIVQL